MVELVAKTYAEALFSVALELNQLNQYREELDFVMESFTHHTDFYELYKIPRISTDEKKADYRSCFPRKAERRNHEFLEDSF